jgi:hypothetical protein
LDVQLDDNLVNGHTYTFSFALENWITFPSESTVMNDLDANAPDFLTSAQVHHQEIVLGKDHYNVQFTYEGDGSDVASDVAGAIVAAVQQGSGDNFTFLSAIDQPLSAVPSQLQTVASTTGAVVGSAVGGAVKNTLDETTKGLGIWIVPIVLLLAVVLLFELGGVSGIRRSVA